MKPDNDPFHEALAPLSVRTWERPEHQRHLERELQEKWTMSMRSNLWAKAALITGIFLAGGIAGASTLAFVQHWLVEETPLPGDMHHVRITDTNTNQVVMDEDVGDDEGIIAIEGNGDGPDTLLRVRPAPDPDPGSAQKAAPEAAPKGTPQAVPKFNLKADHAPAPIH
jgi:hypothetical protein